MIGIFKESPLEGINMSLNEDEVAKKLDKENVLKNLELLFGPVDYNLVALTRESLLKAATEKIPMLSRLLESLGASSESVTKIGERVSNLSNTTASHAIGHGFHIGSTVLAAFDFIRIPFIYLAAYILDKEVPFTLNNNLKWMYSGIVMALAITALVVPVTAPIIGFIAASSGSIISMFLLGKTLYERYKLGREYTKLRTALNREEKQMSLIQQEALALHEHLKQTTDEQSIIDIYTDIVLLQKRYIAQKKVVEQLKTDELHLQQKIGEVGIGHVIDKGVGIALGCLTIVGLSLSLFFPPVGAGILAGAAIIGGIYLVGRLATPLVLSAGQWLISKFKKSEDADIVEKRSENENSLTKDNEAEISALLVPSLERVASAKESMSPIHKEHNDRPHESTADVLVGLLGSNIEVLKTSFEHSTASEPEPVYEKVIQRTPEPMVKDEAEGEGESETHIESEGPPHH